MYTSGAAEYAYDAASLIALDAELKKLSPATLQENIVWNFHPYMGPPQAGAKIKCVPGFEAILQEVQEHTMRPSIITEFGQACCATAGACESCPPTKNAAGEAVGYDEAILELATKHAVSWLPWGWRPPAFNTTGRKCEDLNGGQHPPGLSLAPAQDGGTVGADFAALWAKYAKGGGGAGPPAPPGPPPSGPCPGGSLPKCIALCPASPPKAYTDCVKLCGQRCPPPPSTPLPPSTNIEE